MLERVWHLLWMSLCMLAVSKRAICNLRPFRTQLLVKQASQETLAMNSCCGWLTSIPIRNHSRKTICSLLLIIRILACRTSPRHTLFRNGLATCMRLLSMRQGSWRLIFRQASPSTMPICIPLISTPMESKILLWARWTLPRANMSSEYFTAAWPGTHLKCLLLIHLIQPTALWSVEVLTRISKAIAFFSQPISIKTAMTTSCCCLFMILTITWPPTP